MNVNEVEMLRWVYNNAYPNLTYFFVFILAVLIQFTFSGHVTKGKDLGAWQHIVMHLRKTLLIAYLLIFMLANLYIVIIAAINMGKNNAIEYLKTIYSNMGNNLIGFSSILSIITIFFLPYFFHLLKRRYINPKISAWKRKFRVSQTSDTLSDIRIEKDRFESKTYEVRKYYKKDYVFMGLDENESPVYLTDKEFKGKNLKILGATQTGKGVIMQVLLDQAIMKGWGAWFIDQKPDDFIFSVMSESCKHWGMPEPIILDFTGESIGEYAPFQNGNKRERLQRFYKLFGLEKSGTDADHYKNLNRQVMTYVSDYWDGSLQNLEKILSGKDKSIPEEKRDWIFENSLNIRVRLDEWKLIPNLFPEHGAGFNIQDALNNASTVYVRSRQDDELLREVVTSLLVEWKDCIIKKEHTKHIFTVLDEVKFCISPTVASSLATVLSKEANIALAYQERDDLKSNPDRTVDGEMIKNQVETNTLMSLYYACSQETAEWISKNTGTVQKSINKLERVSTDGFGAENWEGERMIGSEKEYFVTENTIQSMSPRVGVFKNSQNLAQYLFTSWIPVEEKKELPKKEKIDSNSVRQNSTVNVIVDSEHSTPADDCYMNNDNIDYQPEPSFDPNSDPDFLSMLEQEYANEKPQMSKEKIEIKPHEVKEKSDKKPKDNGIKSTSNSTDNLIANIGKK